MAQHRVIELSRTSGLPLSLLDDGRLAFGAGLPAVTPNVRHLSDMRPVLADPAATGPDELYFMYRGVARPGHRPLLAKLGIRYDVTVLAPEALGNEPVKTYGHYHPALPGTTLSYPEIYEVLHGRALYLLQREEAGGDRIEDFIAVEAGAGQKVLIPPGYGHVTVNAGGDWLVMANLVEATFDSIYEPFHRRRGAAYHALSYRNGLTLEPNPAYGQVPAVRRLQPVPRPDLGLLEGIPLYLALIEQGETFRYLVQPADFIASLSLC